MRVWAERVKEKDLAAVGLDVLSEYFDVGSSRTHSHQA